MKTINYSKHIWEGWTVQGFINDLSPFLEMTMRGNSHVKPFTTRKEIKKWCMDNQPYYKKYIPEVVNHFAKQYNITN